MSDFKGKKTALVLSGGVVKAGAWHIGVALALEDLGYTLKHNNSPPSPELEIASYIGSSAGAMISLFFAAGIKPIEITEANVSGGTEKLKPVTYKDMLYFKKSMKKPPRGKGYKPFAEFPLVLRHLLQPILRVSGIFTTEGLNKYLRENIITSDKYEDYKADLFVVATQLDHSHKVIFSKFNYPSPPHDQISVYYTGMSVADSISASMSVPVIYSPYPIKNPYTGKVEYYIDGEVRETLSSHVALDNNCSVMICSWTHSPYHYQDEIGSLVNYGLPAICIQSLYLMIQKKIIASRDSIRRAKDVIDTINLYMKRSQVF